MHKQNVFAEVCCKGGFQNLERILTPRGGGRTYRVCKYAIEHDCDIIVPNNISRQRITTVLFNICNTTDEQTYRNYNFDTNTVQIDKIEGQIEIRIFVASDFSVAYFGNRTKPVVIDDIDECMKRIIGSCPIAAVTMMTYDPAEVALRPYTTLQNECVCDSLI